MFVDKVQVTVKAGDGGNGIVSFRHEKFVDKGGPDGGDGGHGGDVIFEATRNENTLGAFRFHKLLKGDDGRSGSKSRKHGKSGLDLVVKVPVGTIISNETGELLADLTEDGQQMILAHGGKGGFGNAHFTSSTRQTPGVAEKGEPGQAFKADMELKMIADVGLVGLPNAGKSTLISVVSNARPEIADYPFTTLTPNLGVVDIDKQTSLLFADIPGLIDGASQGKGLGDEFLRHVERTSVLLHLIDIYNDDIVKAYKVIIQELKDYQTDMSKRPQIVVLTKIEGLDDEMIADRMKELKKVVPKGTPLFAISSQSRVGLQEMLYAVKQAVDTEHKRRAAEAPIESEIPVYRIIPKSKDFTVEKTDGGYRVKGVRIERFAARTDFESEEGIQRLRDIMRKMGIIRELEKQDVEAGTQILIGNGNFKY